MSSILLVILGSVELGVIYAIMSLGVFLSFRTLDTADLTVDGSFTLGAACSAMLCLAGHPFLGLIAAFVIGCGAGAVTSLLNTKLGIQALLSGILMMLALYSVNLRIMGKPNVPLSGINVTTIYTSVANWRIGENGYAIGKLVISVGILVAIVALLWLFLKTKLGFALRATGDNEDMVRSNGLDTDLMKLLGMALANGLVALSGGMIAQYQKFSDISMGTGMVVIGLASVIIGEVVFGTKSLGRRIIAVSLGSVVYRLIIAVALQLGMPATDLKLVSAVIVAIALAAPYLGKKLKAGKKFNAN
ncbi:MAG: ABC transporter permease [Oscillospiraceae bacterium]|jgi:putative ABC transport system permease protein|nr:ABC transporter permease [Oscillospiraceae bacterium]